jgi:hypothetical protein
MTCCTSKSEGLRRITATSRERRVIDLYATIPPANLHKVENRNEKGGKSKGVSAQLPKGGIGNQ